MTLSFKPKRIPDNTNLRYWHEGTYDGYPLMVDKGPFIGQYWKSYARPCNTLCLTTPVYLPSDLTSGCPVGSRCLMMR